MPPITMQQEEGGGGSADMPLLTKLTSFMKIPDEYLGPRAYNDYSWMREPAPPQRASLVIEEGVTGGGGVRSTGDIFSAFKRNVSNAASVAQTLVTDAMDTSPKPIAPNTGGSYSYKLPGVTAPIFRTAASSASGANNPSGGFKQSSPAEIAAAVSEIAAPIIGLVATRMADKKKKKKRGSPAPMMMPAPQPKAFNATWLIGFALLGVGGFVAYRALKGGGGGSVGRAVTRTARRTRVSARRTVRRYTRRRR